jgi:maltose-binding protein MalE
MGSNPIVARCRRASVVAVMSVGVLMAAGCADQGTSAPDSGGTTGQASASAGAEASQPSLPPGATVAPPPSGTETSAPDGYTVTVLAVEPEGEASAVEGAARTVVDDAERRGIDASVVRGAADQDQDALVAEAIASQPDVVVVVGAASLDAVDRGSATNLSRDFVIVGAQLPEPTSNVTSVIWPGADARSSMTTDTNGGPAPARITDLSDRAGEAWSAGLDSVLAGDTGFVVKLP